MRTPIEIENIDELRRQEGIDDVELREQVGRLQVGDLVRLTFLAGPDLRARETLPVRITRIEGGRFHGRLAAAPARPDQLRLRARTPLVFTAAQIHSVARNPALPRPARKEGRH